MYLNYIPLVEFMYLVFRGTSDGVYVPCMFRYLWWSLCTLYMEVPLVEFMYLVFRRMSGESYCRRLRSLLCLSAVLRALINPLVLSL